MATYRPKSLDELNSLYGKSVEAQKEIKKSETKLEYNAKPIESGFADEDSTQREKTADELASDELASLIEGFSKSFGDEEEKEVKKPQPVSISVQSRPRPVKGPQQVKPTEENRSFEIKDEEKKEDERPRLIRSSERSDLFEDYKKIMDDEDDDTSFSDGFKQSKRKGKKLFSLGHSEPSAETDEQPVQEKEESTLAAEEKAEEAIAPEFAGGEPDIIEQYENSALHNEEYEKIESDDELYDISKQQSLYEKSYEVELPQEEADRESDDFEHFFTVEEEMQEEKKAALQEEDLAPKKKKGAAGQIILLILLICVILASAGVASLKTFFGVNENKLVFDKYRLYTASESYMNSYIEKGDLVITLQRDIRRGELFAYEKSENSFAFGKYDTKLNSQSLIAECDGEKSLVFTDEIRGVIAKVYPSIGAIVALLLTNLLPVLAVLLLVAVIIILVLIFAFRDKSTKGEKKSLFEADDSEEELDE